MISTPTLTFLTLTPNKAVPENILDYKIRHQDHISVLELDIRRVVAKT